MRIALSRLTLPITSITKAVRFLDFNSFSKKQLTALTWWLDPDLLNKYDALICDGAIRSGKTLCMGISFVAWAMKNFDSSTFAICGKTLSSIKRNFLDPLMPVFNNIGFSCNFKVSANLVTINLGRVENKFYLFSGKDEASAAFIQGITLSGILFDEVALMPQSFVEQALARCSVSNSKFWFNCNPEYPQHWFFQDWIKNAATKKALYLHFTMNDNPSLSPEIKKRYESLYSGTFFERFIEGRWVAAEGSVYPEMCNSDSFVDVPNVKFEKYMISCDYGTVNPTSMGLWAKFHETWYRIREYYYDSRKKNGPRTDEEHYSALCELVGNLKIDAITVDPSAASFIALIRHYGKFKVIPAKNNVINGIRKVSSALKSKSLVICNSCKDSMREFSLYRWENSLCKDVPIKENDHAMDDIRYFVSTLMEDENCDDDCFFALACKRH